MQGFVGFPVKIPATRVAEAIVHLFLGRKRRCKAIPAIFAKRPDRSPSIYSGDWHHALYPARAARAGASLTMRR
jgi:hypothetical protein